MTTKTYDLVIKTGTYTDANGEEKGRYQNVGAMLEKDGRNFLVIEPWFNPAGAANERGQVFVSLFEPTGNPSSPRHSMPASAPHRTGDYSAGRRRLRAGEGLMGNNQKQEKAPEPSRNDEPFNDDIPFIQAWAYPAAGVLVGLMAAAGGVGLA